MQARRTTLDLTSLCLADRGDLANIGTEPGLAYDFFLHPADDDRIGRGGRVESVFQRYCRAALTAVGDFTEISARQVANYKKEH